MKHKSRKQSEARHGPELTPRISIPSLPASAVGPGVPVAAMTPAEAAASSLTTPQQKAVVLLTSGRTRIEAATAAGVSRTTVYRWLAEDPVFQAALNAWQADVRTTASAQLLAATHDAVAAVTAAVRGGDKALAWKLLTAQGLTTPRPVGSADAAVLARQQTVAKKRAEIAARRESSEINFADMTTFNDFPDPPVPLRLPPTPDRDPPDTGMEDDDPYPRCR